MKKIYKKPFVVQFHTWKIKKHCIARFQTWKKKISWNFFTRRERFPWEFIYIFFNNEKITLFKIWFHEWKSFTHEYKDSRENSFKTRKLFFSTHKKVSENFFFLNLGSCMKKNLFITFFSLNWEWNHLDREHMLSINRVSVERLLFLTFLFWLYPWLYTVIAHWQHHHIQFHVVYESLDEHILQGFWHNYLCGFNGRIYAYICKTVSLHLPRTVNAWVSQFKSTSCQTIFIP